MENQMYYKAAYKCGICGNEFASVQERMNCEMACVKKQKEEEKNAAEAKKQAEQKARKEEIDAALKNLRNLLANYINEYGHYEYEEDNEIGNFHLPSRIWNRFWY